MILIIMIVLIIFIINCELINKKDCSKVYSLTSILAFSFIDSELDIIDSPILQKVIRHILNKLIQKVAS